MGQFGVPEVLEGVFALVAKRLNDMVQNREGFIDIATLFNYLTGIIALFFRSRQINKKHFGLLFNLIVVFFFETLKTLLLLVVEVHYLYTFHLKRNNKMRPRGILIHRGLVRVSLIDRSVKILHDLSDALCLFALKTIHINPVLVSISEVEFLGRVFSKQIVYFLVIDLKKRVFHAYLAIFVGLKVPLLIKKLLQKS